MAEDNKKEWGELNSPPMFGTDLKAYSVEWDECVNILRPKNKIENKAVKRIVDKVVPIRYGHAIRYEWRQVEIYDIDE